MKLKSSSLIRDISQTFVVELIVLAGFVVIYRIIAVNFGSEGVGEYSLIKRVIALLQPLLILGFTIGIPRYIALCGSKEEAVPYAQAGFASALIFVILLLLLLNAFGGFFSKIFFGSTSYAHLVFPFSVLMFGLSLHVLVYSYFRGNMHVRSFNSLQTINLAVAPVAILAFSGNVTLARLVMLMGISTAVISVIFMIPFAGRLFMPPGKKVLGRSLRELLIYSLPRVPGEFAMAGLFSLSPVLAVHFASMRDAGYLAVSQSLVTGICGMAAPLGIILLPKVSSLAGQGKQERISEGIGLVNGAVFQFSIFLFFQLIIFTDAIIMHWLGPGFAGATCVFQIALISVFFYMYYISMRSILDAVLVKPVNTFNIFLSLGLLLGLTAVLLIFCRRSIPAIISISIAFAAGLVLLGILTYASVRKLYPDNHRKDMGYISAALIINLPIAFIAFVLKKVVSPKLIYLLFFEMAACVAYFSLLWLFKTEWIRRVFGSMTEKTGAEQV